MPNQTNLALFFLSKCAGGSDFQSRPVFELATSGTSGKLLVPESLQPGSP